MSQLCIILLRQSISSGVCAEGKKLERNVIRTKGYMFLTELLIHICKMPQKIKFHYVQ